MWTQFWDMHSGGSQKEQWARIYIQAPESVAIAVFENKFGHDPRYVTCPCCGSDYSISEYETLEQASAYHRNCRWIEPEKKGKSFQGYYLEGDELPEGYKFRYESSYGEYIPLDDYIEQDDVLVIPSTEIKEQQKR